MPQTVHGERMYLATVTVEMIVLAKDDQTAHRVALDNAAEEIGNGLEQVDLREVRTADAIPFPWRTCIPWRDDFSPEASDESTCADVFASMIPTDAEVEAAGQLSLADG